MSTLRTDNIRTLDDTLNIPLTSIALKSELNAATISVVPTGGISETNVQAALAGLDTRVTARQPLDATLTALAGVTTSTDNIIYSTASDTFTTAVLTPFARTLIDDTSAAAMRTTLGTTSLVAATAQVTTSGTSIDFTAIPAGVKRITIVLSGVSTNNTSPLIIQLGTSGGIVSTGYAGTTDSQASAGGVTTSFTAGLGLGRDGDAGYLRSGICTLINISGNTWVGTWLGGSTGSGVQISFGNSTLTLGAVLDRVRLTTVGGVNTFDAGTVNILYEG